MEKIHNVSFFTRAQTVERAFRIYCFSFFVICLPAATAVAAPTTITAPTPTAAPTVAPVAPKFEAPQPVATTSTSNFLENNNSNNDDDEWGVEASSSVAPKAAPVAPKAPTAPAAPTAPTVVQKAAPAPKKEEDDDQWGSGASQPAAPKPVV